MSSPITPIHPCHTCHKDIIKPTDIYKEVDRKIYYCSKECLDKRDPSYTERKVEVQEHRRRKSREPSDFLINNDEFVKFISRYANSIDSNDTMPKHEE